MKNIARRLALSAALCTATLCALPAHAGFTSMVVFGDSLSDTGNVFLATGGAIPAAPYFQGRFSDGPIWIDHIATGLGLPAGAVPSFGGGTNYAFGGARTGAAGAPVPGLLAQIGGLWGPANPLGADPDALYVVVGGGNDMRDARSTFSGNTAADEAGRQAAAATAAGNITAAVNALASAGARHILISNLPDLGATPEAVDDGVEAASSDATARYNALVAGIEAMMEGLFADLDVMTFDMAGVASVVLRDALNHGGAAFGLTNATEPCGAFAVPAGPSCAVSGFSDDLHPSAAMHAIIGGVALRLINNVPEPATVVLVVLALAGLGARRARS